MRFQKPPLLAFLISIASFTPAGADIVTLTVTGTIAPLVWNGSRYITAPLIDTAGTFGVAGATLTGDAFTATWSINTSCICSVTNDEVSGGGQIIGGASPVLSSTLNITGHAFDFGSNGYGVFQVYQQSGLGSGVYANITVTPGTLAMNTYINSNNTSTFGGGLTTPFDHTFDPLHDNINTLGGGFSIGSLNGYFLVDRMTLSNQAVAAVPAPVVAGGLPGAALTTILIWLYRRRNTPLRVSRFSH